MGVKLFWPSVIVMMVLLTGIILGFRSFDNVRKQMMALYLEPYSIKMAAGSVNETFEAMQKSVFRAISNEYQDITDEAVTDAKNDFTLLREQFALLRENTYGDIDLLNKIEKNLSELEQMQEHVLALAAENKKSEAAEYMENCSIPVIEEMQAELEQFIQTADAKELKLVSSLRRTQNDTILLLILFGAASVMFSIGILIKIVKLHKKGSRQ